MKMCSFATAAQFGLTILLAQALAAHAAEIKVLSAASMAPAMKEIGLQFEQGTGHKLSMQFDVTAAIKKKIDAGEPFDVVVSTRGGIDDLIKAGKVIATTRTDLAHAGMGVAVRAGAPKPDLSSVDAFRRTLLDAKSITYSQEGPTGRHLASVLQRLGIAEQVKSKTKLQVGGARVAQAVAEGEAELGFTALSIILLTRGAEVAGPFPSELQDYAVFTTGIAVNAAEAEAAKALVKFLAGPVAAPVLKAKGMEPGTPK